MLKMNNKSIHVVFGNPCDPNAKTADGIMLNKKYRLIYTNAESPEKFALKEMYGFQLIEGMSIINSDIVDDYYSFGEFRSAVLIPVVENWGRKKMNMPYATGASKNIKKMLNWAFKGNKKYMRTIEAHLSAYMASKIEFFDPESNAVLIKDGKNSDVDYESAAPWIKQTITREKFDEINMNLGSFTIDYISKEELKKYLPQ